MAPKGTKKGKALARKDPTSEAEEQSHEGKPPMKKPKKEPEEEQEEVKNIGDKKELDKMYQAMKYQAKKKK
jgi:hypothetical protein